MSQLSRISLCLAGFLVGSMGCSGPDVESYVGAPTTLEVLQALHDPPTVELVVTRVVESPGASPCHGSVCLIIAPILLVGALFPEKYDSAVLTKNGVETWRGRFQTNGRLIQAELRDGDSVRWIRRLDLAALDRAIVVEVARAEPGHEDDPTPTSISSQMDLIGEYRAALVLEEDGEERGELLAEALTWLGHEAVPMVTERMMDPDEPDPSKAEVMDALCQLRNSGEDEPDFVASLLNSSSTISGPETAQAALACVSGPLGQPYRLTLVDAVCEGDDPGAYLGTLRGEHCTGVVLQRAKDCSNIARSVLIGQSCDQPMDPVSLHAALASRDDSVQSLLGGLDPGEPVERAGLFFALQHQHGPPDLIVDRILLDERALSPEELVVLARSYARGGSFLSPAATRRAHSLDLMSRTDNPATATAARVILKSLARAEKEDERSPFLIAMVVLGDRQLAGHAALGLGGPHSVLDVHSHAGNVFNDRELVAYGLILAGCSEPQVVALHQAKDGPGEGALCTR